MATKCPVCSKNTTKIFYKDLSSVYSSRPHNVLHCSNCDHYFTDPLPNDKELSDIYTNRYSYDAHSLINSEKQMRAHKYAEIIANLGIKNALEVGCMHGLLLSELEGQGLKVSGVELDQESVDYCRAAGLDVKQGSLEDYVKKGKGKYGAAIMSHVLEHIVKPKKGLEGLSNHIAKDGLLIIIVPNSNAKTRKLFGRYWGYWQVPIHINHFNKNSMTKLLIDAGYKDLQFKYFGADSLFFLSSFANRLSSSSDTQTLSPAKRLLVKISTIILRPWYYVGGEDMLVIARKV